MQQLFRNNYFHHIWYDPDLLTHGESFGQTEEMNSRYQRERIYT